MNLYHLTPSEFVKELDINATLHDKVFDVFRKRYATMYPPPPEKPKMEIPFTVIVNGFIGLATILLAAMRTFDAFFIAAGGDSGKALAEGIFAVIAIEGYLFFDGFRRVRFMPKKRRDEAASNSMKLAAKLTFAISIAAGLYQSFGVIPDSLQSSYLVGFVYKFLVFVLVVLMGVGATYLAHAGGQVFATVIMFWEEERKRSLLSHKQSWKAYEQNLRRKWEKSEEYKHLQTYLANANFSEQTNEQDSEHKQFANESEQEKANKRKQKANANKQTNDKRTVSKRTKQTNKRGVNKRLLFAMFDELYKQTQTLDSEQFGITNMTRMFVNSLLTSEQLANISEHELNKLIANKKGYVSQTFAKWREERGF